MRRGGADDLFEPVVNGLELARSPPLRRADDSLIGVRPFPGSFLDELSEALRRRHWSESLTSGV
jgi:hypothetical protein